jgi:hypothetical protein
VSTEWTPEERLAAQDEAWELLDEALVNLMVAFGEDDGWRSEYDSLCRRLNELRTDLRKEVADAAEREIGT